MMSKDTGSLVVWTDVGGFTYRYNTEHYSFKLLV